MGNAFSDDERNMIRDRLKEVAQECLLKYGVRKTTVDEIVKRVGISKGSFYNFYPQKEVLFFTVLEEYQKSIIDGLTERLEGEEYIGAERFADLIYELFDDVRESFLMSIIQNREIEYLMRKLPKEVIEDHHSLDTLLMEKVLSHVRIKEGVDAELVAASLRAIAMNMIYAEEIGEENFDDMLKLLIRGVAIQVVEEEHGND